MSKENLKHVVAVERCKSCGLCVVACPKKTLAIGDNLNAQSYAYVEQIKPEKCVKCNICRIVCPDIAVGCITISA